MENSSEIPRGASTGAADDSQERPLSQRINKARGRLKTKIEAVRKERESGVNDLYGLGTRVECVHCGAVRVRPDPTGLTCGNPRCLAGLLEKFDEFEQGPSGEEEQLRELLVSIAKSLAEKPKGDLSLLELAENIDEALTDLRTEQKNLEEMIITIAEKLGLKRGEDEGMLVFVGRMDIVVEELQYAVEQLEIETEEAGEEEADSPAEKAGE